MPLIPTVFGVFMLVAGVRILFRPEKFARGLSDRWRFGLPPLPPEKKVRNARFAGVLGCVIGIGTLLSVAVDAPWVSG
jgi:hypothetical protein